MDFVFSSNWSVTHGIPLAPAPTPTPAPAILLASVAAALGRGREDSVLTAKPLVVCVKKVNKD